MSNRSFLCRIDGFRLKFLPIFQAHLASSVYMATRAWQKNPRKRKRLRQPCISRNFSEKLLHQAGTYFFDCFDMFCYCIQIDKQVLSVDDRPRCYHVQVDVIMCYHRRGETVRKHHRENQGLSKNKGRKEEQILCHQ